MPTSPALVSACWIVPFEVQTSAFTPTSLSERVAFVSMALMTLVLGQWWTEVVVFSDSRKEEVRG